MTEYLHPEGLLAYFITFTTYGTHLHGDERGSVNPSHNTFGDPRLPIRPGLVAAEQAVLRQRPFVMAADHRAAVNAAIVETCAVSGWDLSALNVRTNHVHALVAVDRAPERVMNSFKVWATRRMREKGLVAADALVRTRHASMRSLWNDLSVAATADYINHWQGEELPGSIPAHLRPDCAHSAHAD